jgi:sulfur carrier protein
MTTAPPAPLAGFEIRINGQPRTVAPGSTLATLVEELGKDPRTIAIEKNGDIVRRAAFGDTRLAPGDVLEIVQFVQGG